MKHFFQIALAFLFIFLINNNIVAQKKTKQKLTSIDFEYQGNKFLIQKGTKFNIGTGSADNGSFNYITRNEQVSGSTFAERNMDKSDANRNAEVKNIRYIKYSDSYEITISISKVFYQLKLYEGVTKGEITGIDDYFFEQNNNPKENNNTSKNALTHVLKLKNGSEIKCKVIEFKPTESVKIETFDGSIFVYKAEEIEELITYEVSISTQETQNKSEYRNGTITGNFEEVINKKDSSLKTFYNGLEFSLFIPLSDDKGAMFTTKYGGVGIRYIVGHKFSHFFMLGGVVGFNTFIGNKSNEPTYYNPYFGITEKFSLLKNKNISPEINLIHAFGSKLSSQNLGTLNNELNIGVTIKSKNKLTYNTGLGLLHQYILTYPGGIGLYGKLNFGVSF